jgi:hypothetical protein
MVLQDLLGQGFVLARQQCPVATARVGNPAEFEDGGDVAFVMPLSVKGLDEIPDEIGFCPVEMIQDLARLPVDGTQVNLVTVFLESGYDVTLGEPVFFLGHATHVLRVIGGGLVDLEEDEHLETFLASSSHGREGL